MRRTVLTAIAVFVLAGAVYPQQDERSAAISESRIQVGVRGGLNLATMTGRLWGISQFYTDVVGNYPGITWTGGFSKSSVSDIVFGGFLNYAVTPSFSIQPELLYIKKGVECGGAVTIEGLSVGTVNMDLKERLKLTYLEIPVLAKIKIPVRGKIRPSLFGGPALAIKLSGKYEYTNLYNEDGTLRNIALEPKISNMKSTDFGLVMGADLNIPVGRATLVLDARYTMGLSGQFGTSGTESLPDWEYDELPPEFPVAIFEGFGTVKNVPDMKNSVVSITAGVAFDL